MGDRDPIHHTKQHKIKRGKILSQLSIRKRQKIGFLRNQSRQQEGGEKMNVRWGRK